jgi:diadenosine tetraphosphatase ApaH/serine/threonine PP2A family protein phosphatase
MRIAVLADVHGNLPALEAALSHLEAQGGYDEIWVLGDLVVFCPYPAEVLERLTGLPNARFLQGNTDRYLVTGRRPPQMTVEDESQWKRMPGFLEERDANFRWTVEQVSYNWYSFLRELPFEQRVDIPGYGTVLGVHASPLGDEVGIWEDTGEDELRDILAGIEARLLLCGHTHRQLGRWLEDEVGVVNGGSVGLPLDGDQRAAYAILDFEGGDCWAAFHRVTYDVGEVIDRLEEVEHPALEWVGTRLRLAGHP